MKKVAIAFFSLFFISTMAFANLPEPPTNPDHPGSLVYAFDVEVLTQTIDSRRVDIFLPVGATNVPVIVYGHGQSLNHESYQLKFEHLAKKGYAVIHPMYDTGFFDRDWKRQGKDFNSLARKTIDQLGDRVNPEAVIFSGHSKGGYAALTAAILPDAQMKIEPQALVLFNLAGYVKEWVNNIDLDIPVTITYSVSDTIIKEELVREIYNSLPSNKKQLITLQSYKRQSADHFFPMTKSYWFGGVDGIGPFHYYGTFKWLIGAADDITQKSGQTNPYVYGDLTTRTGAGFEHKVERNFQDYIVHLDGKADLSKASSIKNRTERIQYVYDQLRKQFLQSSSQLLSSLSFDQKRVKPLYISNALLVKSLSVNEVSLLNNMAGVKKLTPDIRVVLTEVENTFPSEAFGGLPTPIKKIRANEAWELGVKGKGIVIAGQDTGYDWTHPAIQSQYRGYSEKGAQHDYNWFDATDGKSMTPYDDNSHGTHTMGNMVGYGGEDRRIGVAPEAKWIGCRNMVSGVGKPSTYMGCFQFFLAPHPMNGDPLRDGRADMAPHIINNSWSCPESEGCSGDDLLASVQAMKAAGIFVVVAAGNDGSNCDTLYEAPAMYSDATFAVGAFNTFINDMAWFSSRGPSRFDGGVGVDIVAPGAPVTSSVPGGGYDSKMGTSMAAPHVAGAVALLWSHRPELIGDIEATTQLLHSRAIPKRGSQSCGPYSGGNSPNAVWGHGFLDIMKLIGK